MQTIHPSIERLEKKLKSRRGKRRTDEDEKAIQISLRKQVFGENYT